MNTVIYDPEDFEPITVIDVPRRWFNEFDEGREPYLEIPIFTGVRCERVEDFLPSLADFKVCRLRFERFHYRDIKRWFAFATDPEMALLLKSIFLPGQTTALNKEKKRAMAHGFLEALQLALR